MLTVTSTNRQVHEEDVARIESAIGHPLPEAYRAFLLKHNGGQPEPDTIDIEGAPFNGTVIHDFHGIDDEFKSSDLLWAWETLTGCKENLILPIAHDSFGHTFGLILGKLDHGHIYYFDSDESPPRPYLVATDFNEFLSKLRAPRPDELADDDESAHNPPETDPSTSN